jgi:hypothetical protein
MNERIVLAPHCSLTARQGALFFAGVCAGSFGFAGLLALKGFWPVLPFAGLEMGLLGWALKRSLDRRHRMQTVLISEEEVRIQERVKQGLRDDVVFPRYWAQVKLRPAFVPSHPSRLTDRVERPVLRAGAVPDGRGKTERRAAPETAGRPGQRIAAAWQRLMVFCL